MIRCILIINYNHIKLDEKEKENIIINMIEKSFNLLDMDFTKYENINNSGYFHFKAENEKDIDELFKSLYFGFGIDKSNNHIFRIDFLN